MTTTTMRSRLLSAPLILTVPLLTWLVSCASPKNSTPQPPGAAQHSNGFEVPGLGQINPRTDRKESIIGRFGRPAGEERRGAEGEYEILTYPGTPENWLLLFHKDEVLGVFCESARGALESTVQGHARVQRREIILFQSWSNGQTVYFVTSQEQLERLPKCGANAKAPPLGRAEAEQRAQEWRQQVAPELQGEPKVQKVLESKTVPGTCYYLVDVDRFSSNPQLRQVLVLMDGSVISGVMDSHPGQRSAPRIGHPGVSGTQSEHTQDARGAPPQPPVAATGADSPRLMIEGRNTYFLADMKKATAMQDSVGEAPLSRAAAESAVRGWLRRVAPGLDANPKVSELSRADGSSGHAYYHVDLGIADAPIRLQEVLVLMDGTVVESAMKDGH